MCNFCMHGEWFEIEEASGRNKLVKDKLKICVDVDHLSIDYSTKEADGFFIDIDYCPKCGQHLASMPESQN